MGRGLIAFGLAAALLTCTGCGDSESRATPAAVPQAKPALVVKAPESQRALRFSPGHDDFKKTMIRPTRIGDEGAWPEWYRIPGDSFSKHYLITTSADGSNIRDDKGRELIRTYQYPYYFGIRKTSSATDVFFYYIYDETLLASYDVAVIEGGRSQLLYCTIDQATVELATGKRFKTRKELVDGLPYANSQIVDLLTSAAPNRQRDHCVPADSVYAARMAAMEPPVPVTPFPKVGDMLALDRAPLIGGWYHTGGGFYGPGDDDCCVDHYDGDDGRAAFIVTDPVARRVGRLLEGTRDADSPYRARPPVVARLLYRRRDGRHRGRPG